MRLAGEYLEDTSAVTTEANAAIKRAYQNPHHGFSMEDTASHHVDLDRGKEGVINDGDNRSIIYKGGNKIEAEVEGFGTPLPDQPAGSRELRDLPQERLNEYNQIWNENNIRRNGTGNMASNFMPAGYGGSDNTVPFAPSML